MSIKSIAKLTKEKLGISTVRVVGNLDQNVQQFIWHSVIWIAKDR